jgi:hypothetical protein
VLTDVLVLLAHLAGWEMLSWGWSSLCVPVYWEMMR